MGEALRLRGVATVPLLAAALLTAALAAGMGVTAGGGGRLWLAWLSLQLMVAMVGLVSAVVVGSRRLALENGVLRYRSATRQLFWPTREIESVGYEAHPTLSWHAYLTLRHVAGGELRLNVYLWHQSELAALLRALRSANPALQLSPAARGYLAVAR